MAEDLKAQVEAKTGKTVEVDIQSMRKKDDVKEKIMKLRDLLK